MSVLFFLLFLVSLISLIVGLIKPTAFSRFIKGEITRKRIWLIFGISTFVLFILTGMFADTTAIKKEENTTNPGATTSDKISQSMVFNDQIEEQQPVVENNEVRQEDKNINSAPVVENSTSMPTPTPASTPAQAPQTNDQNISPAPSETVSQKNAVRSAKAYLGYSAFSHVELVAQLEYDKFSHADAVYGVDNSGADWNEQATKSAKQYMEYVAFSHDGLVAQLEYDKFSHANAVYGVDNSGADWNEQATKSAKQYMEYSAFSRGGLIEQLKNDKFTQAQAEYGANAVGL